MKETMKNKLKSITRTEVVALPEAKDGMSYFAIGDRCWGKAPTAIGAVEQARRNGRGPFALHYVNRGAEVDSVDGTLMYNSKTSGLKIGIGLVR